MLAAALGIALVLLVAVYAHSTTVALGEDFYRFTSPLATILTFPVSVLEGFLTIVVPLAVLSELAIRRQVRLLLECFGAALVSFGVTWGTHWLIAAVGQPILLEGLSVADATAPGGWRLTIPAYLAAMTALLLVAGPANRRLSVKWGWRLLIFTTLAVVIMGQVSVTGLLLTVLIGTLLAHATLYSAGVASERAYGADLVLAIERAGWQPQTLLRVGGAVDSSATDSTVAALARSSHTRIYAMWAEDGNRYDVEILDGDRQVPSVMQRLWRVIRLRGLGTRAVFSLKAATERTALLSYASTAAGVRTPKLLGVGMADDSAALVFEHLPTAAALRDLPDTSLAGATGELLMADAWAQLQAAHRAGLAHHQLTPDVILVNTDQPQVWISGWDQGEIAASQLGKRLDLVQLLAIFALRVGPERALAAATEAVPATELAAIGPLLQTVALPPEIQTAVRRKRGLLPEMRRVLADHLPAADVTNQAQIARFTPRQVVMLAATIIAVLVVVTTINFAQIQAAIMGANPWWVGYSIGFSLLTLLGAACTLIAFTPNRLPLWRTVLVQLAGSFVALATPAGIGPAALNMRYLNRKQVPTATGLAVVALMQVSQVVVTVLMLLVLSLATGTGGGLVLLPSATMLIALVLVVAAVLVVALMPPLRAIVWAKVAPTLRQLWPRLSEMLSQPTRFAMGLGGNLMMSFGYVMAFYAAMRAFGFTLGIANVAVIYLVGNTIGALLPTPGGLGGVEGALVAGLTTAGLPIAIATTVTLLFRLVTYWLRIPFGWAALKALERRNDL